MLEGTAGTLSSLGRNSDALHSWDRAIQYAKGPTQGDLRLGRAVTLARMNEPEQATAAAESVLAEDRSAWTLYSAARVYAVSSTMPGIERKTAENYAARAVELLGKAAEEDAQSIEDMKNETHLESIRERADFKQLLKDFAKKAPGNARKK
jgi:hypothetical protein